MRRNKHIPAHFGTNAARQAQTRYLRGKTPESERVEKNRRRRAMRSPCASWLRCMTATASGKTGLTA